MGLFHWVHESREFSWDRGGKMKKSLPARLMHGGKFYGMDDFSR